jgi:ABC-type transporter Mla subunit MlaD
MRGKAREAASKMADVAQQAGGQAKQAVSSLASDASQKAKGLLNTQVTAGADLVGHLAQSARAAADSLDQNAPQLAHLVRGAAERAEDFSRDLHDRTFEDLVRTASDFTRQQPALVFGLASLAGFLAFRVFKSTPPRSPASRYREEFYGT